MGESVNPPAQGWIFNHLGRSSLKHFARQVEIADQAIEMIEKEIELKKRVGGLHDLVPSHGHREGPAVKLFLDLAELTGAEREEASGIHDLNGLQEERVGNADLAEHYHAVATYIRSSQLKVKIGFVSAEVEQAAARTFVPESFPRETRIRNEGVEHPLEDEMSANYACGGRRSPGEVVDVPKTVAHVFVILRAEPVVFVGAVVSGYSRALPTPGARTNSSCLPMV